MGQICISIPIALQHQQMMNTFTIFDDLKLYVVVCDNLLQICNHNQIVIYQKQIDFNFYESYTNDLNKFGGMRVLQAHLYQPVISKGNIYFMCFNQIYVLKDTSIHQLVSVPLWVEQIVSPDKFICQLFSYKDDLYVSSSKGIVYQVEDNMLFYIKHFQGQFYQYCDTVLCYSSRDGYIYQIVDNFEFVKLFEVGLQWDLQFCGGGILIGLALDQYIIIDIVHRRILGATKEYVFNRENIASFLELSHSGFCVMRPVIKDYISDTAHAQLQNEYYAFIKRQVSSFPSYSSEMCNLIRNFDSKLADSYSKKYITVKQLQPNKLHQCRQKFRTRIFPHLDLYLVFDDYFISVIDSNNTIHFTQIQQEVMSWIQQKVNQYVKSYCFNTSLFRPEYFRSIYCNGRLYFQLIDSVFVLNRNQLIFVNQIPNLNMNFSSAIYLKLFTLNDCLFVLNGINQIYVLNKINQFEFVLESEMCAGFAFVIGEEAYLLNMIGYHQIKYEQGIIQFELIQAANLEEVSTAFEFIHEKHDDMQVYAHTTLFDFNQQITYFEQIIKNRFNTFNLKRNIFEQFKHVLSSINTLRNKMDRIGKEFVDLFVESCQ
ncbi:Conserved_hypothetical protein [Hexamita inflata]|uniref:Uncharacterized protein n=1 Tax=Hexamita inflata TaxID=28002 RepID=A0AA86UNP7_9EUKA|nr:Conserved hypothetical protein [Hexamita inflata]